MRVDLGRWWKELSAVSSCAYKLAINKHIESGKISLYEDFNERDL